MSFEDISGHKKEIEILVRAMLNGRVAHSYLFTGPVGTGKRTLAKEFARALNCGAGEGDACGVCADCVAMESGSHANLMEVGPEDKDGKRDEKGLIRIGRIRELQDALRFKSGSGKKVAIIDDADRLVPEAANAFLKTLEEPPADSVIILVSSRPRTLLPTILSRCQKINFKPLPEELIRDFLVGKAAIAADDAGAIARLSAGSVSAALKFMEKGVFERRREIVEKLSALKGGGADDVLVLARELSGRKDIEEVLEFLKTWCRDAAVYNEGSPALMVNADLRGLVKAPAGSKGLVDSFLMIERARRETSPPFYANKQLAMEVLLMGLVEKGALI